MDLFNATKVLTDFIEIQSEKGKYIDITDRVEEIVAKSKKKWNRYHT